LPPLNPPLVDKEKLIKLWKSEASLSRSTNFLKDS